MSHTTDNVKWYETGTLTSYRLTYVRTVDLVHRLFILYLFICINYSIN